MTRSPSSFSDNRLAPPALESGAPEADYRGIGRSILTALATIGIGLCLISLAFPSEKLSQVPVAERKALYSRTLETLRTTCAATPGPELSEYCQEQAAFLKRFPECDHECREVSARFQPAPTR